MGAETYLARLCTPENAADGTLARFCDSARIYSENWRPHAKIIYYHKRRDPLPVSTNEPASISRKPHLVATENDRTSSAPD